MEMAGGYDYVLVDRSSPYPYWVFSDNEGHWYFHFFHGFTLQKLPLPTFGFVFVVSLALFAVIFWAVSGLRNAGARTGSM